MADILTLDVAESFSATPFGRYRSDGPESGQVFREDLLIPALSQHDKVVIDVDHVAGLPSSFWEEALGGLVRDGWTADQLRSRLDIVAHDPEMKVYVRLGWRYVSEAEKARKN